MLEFHIEDKNGRGITESFIIGKTGTCFFRSKYSQTYIKYATSKCMACSRDSINAQKDGCVDASIVFNKRI